MLRHGCIPALVGAECDDRRLRRLQVQDMLTVGVVTGLNPEEFDLLILHVT